MTWALVIILTVAVFAALAWVLRAPRAGWEAIGAALLLGIAGFAAQARTAQPGAPKAAAESSRPSGAAAVEARKALADGTIPPGDRWTTVADAFARNGQFAEAAGVVLGAVEQDPRNGDAWLALANNLVAHAEGNLSPAALYAYRQAETVNPQHPGPPFFLGLALAQSGRLAEGREVWAGLLARTPADAPWRADLARRLADLDAFIARQQATPR